MDFRIHCIENIFLLCDMCSMFLYPSDEENLNKH